MLPTEWQSIFFSSLVLLPNINDFNVFFLSFLFYVHTWCMNHFFFVFFFSFQLKKKTNIDRLNHKTITYYNDDETDPFSFCSSLRIGIVAIWHHQALQMDIKGLRFKGTHQLFPVQLEEVKCHQFKIM